MLTGIFLISICILLVFFICALRLSSKADKEMEKYLYSKSDNKNMNITK